MDRAGVQHRIVIAGAGYAAATKDGDISLPAGTHILVTLTQRLNITRS